MTREKRKPKRPEDVSRRWVEHATYGRVLLVRHTSTLAGKTYERWHDDPSFKPKRPRGSSRATSRDRRSVRPVTRRRTFTSTRSGAAASAARRSRFRGEQKHWYETRRFNVRSAPIRCAALPPAAAERAPASRAGRGRAPRRREGPARSGRARGARASAHRPARADGHRPSRNGDRGRAEGGPTVARLAGGGGVGAESPPRSGRSAMI